jgi:uncharacterized protein (DUF1800 family)
MADTTKPEAIDPRWAWAPYQPSDRSAWDIKQVGHLYRRAAFGATAVDLDAALKAGPEKAVDALLHAAADDDPAVAAFVQQTDPLAQSIARANNGPQLRAWWLYRMLYSPQPLREKLTLFWHNHFATSNAKLQNVGSMLGQYRLMHKHALGNFAVLLQEMSKDPAMLVWLDTRGSKKGTPNENYARELMELFSLGPGNYTEKDIREAARAFTGWDLKDGKAVFKADAHDDGEKIVLGQTGKWQGEDIVRFCLDQEAAPRFIARKLFRFLISETLPAMPDLIEPLAEQLRKSNWDFGGLVRTVLRSNLFFSPLAYRSSIKSPVEFAIGIVRGLEGRIGTTQLALALEGLGQSIFYPPSVKGWDGGPAWLNGQTLLYRQNLSLALTSTEDDRFGRRCDPAALVRKHGKQSDEDVVEFLVRLFLQGDVTPDARAKLVAYLAEARKRTYPAYWSEQDVADHRIRAVCHLVLTLPEFQLN